MGVPFYEHPGSGGSQMVACKVCNLPITNKANLRSEGFTGHGGPAHLFTKVVNVVMKEIKESDLTSGKHWLRDVHCKKCAVKLGWFYVKVQEKRNAWKIGHTLLCVADFVLVNGESWDKGQPPLDGQ